MTMMRADAEQTLYTEVESPIGRLLLRGDGDGETLHGLYMLDGPHPVAISAGWRRSPEAFAEVERQLQEYFAGRRRAFELALTLKGSPFQRSVWDALQQIGYGETASYGEIARSVGQPAAARGVGIANARNPIAVIVPCHRVIGADGTLTGYGGGLERKRFLLELERSTVGPHQLPLEAARAASEMAGLLGG
jgi:methylated-DNA-[protein]-cysteine S-methyltransferase